MSCKKDLQYYAIKCKLKSLLKFKEWESLIQQRVDIINKIWIESYFLFNLYVLHFLEKNNYPSFDKVTINRCVLFVLGIDDTIRDRDIEYLKLDYVYNNIYSKIGDPKIRQYSNIKSITKPFEFLSNQMITNIHNHIKLNFHKFQRTYLKSIVFDQCSILKLKKNIMYSILGCVQYHINNIDDRITIRSKLLLKHENLELIIKIIKSIVSNERHNIPKSIMGNTTHKNIKDNYKDVLHYFKFMIDYLEVNEKKRFSLLPQINFGYTYIKFESRLLSVIFDEWMGNLQSEIDIYGEQIVKKKYNIDFELKQVGIKQFEEKYKDYYKKCFNLDKFNLKNKNGDIDNPISISTNGYTACVLFERKISKNDSNTNETKRSTKINLDTYFINSNGKEKEFKRGLFDADQCKASDDFLEKFNKTSIDPNNDVMLYCYDESGKKITITKGYYLEESHIRKNSNSMKRYIKNDKMDELYRELSDIGYKKTTSKWIYIDFIRIYRKNHNKIWSFYNQNKIKKLEFDTYINKRKTIHKIVRKIIPKKGKQRKYNNYRNKNIDNKKYEENKDKPNMVFFGKGNGTTTISNLKNNGPKGPIKMIANELSRYCITILTDEYNTSKISSSDKKGRVEHPIIEYKKK